MLLMISNKRYIYYNKDLVEFEGMCPSTLFAKESCMLLMMFGETLEEIFSFVFPRK